MVAMELCCETASQHLNPYWGSTCGIRPEYVLETTKELLFAILQTTVGRILRPNLWEKLRFHALPALGCTNGQVALRPGQSRASHTLANLRRGCRMTVASCFPEEIAHGINSGLTQ